MQNITILDGGMGQELVRRTTREITPLWSADIMLNEPALVRDLHLEFIDSGADVITLNTYTATPQRLERDASISMLEPLHAAAMKAAKEAVALSGKDEVKIAGCLPPLVASYHPDLAPGYEQMLSSYQKLVALQAPASDIFICETMASIKEARAACTVAKASGKVVWVAFTLTDDDSGQLRSGEPLSTAIAEIGKLAPDAVLLNCSRPEAINAALPMLEKAECKTGIYANGFTSVNSLYPGTTVESLDKRKDLTPDMYADHALYWAGKGIDIIGGCCEIGPGHIAAVKEKLDNLITQKKSE